MGIFSIMKKDKNVKGKDTNTVQPKETKAPRKSKRGQVKIEQDNVDLGLEEMEDNAERLIRLNESKARHHKNTESSKGSLLEGVNITPSEPEHPLDLEHIEVDTTYTSNSTVDNTFKSPCSIVEYLYHTLDVTEYYNILQDKEYENPNLVSLCNTLNEAIKHKKIISDVKRVSPKTINSYIVEVYALQTDKHYEIQMARMEEEHKDAISLIHHDYNNVINELKRKNDKLESKITNQAEEFENKIKEQESYYSEQLVILEEKFEQITPQDSPVQFSPKIIEPRELIELEKRLEDTEIYYKELLTKEKNTSFRLRTEKAILENEFDEIKYKLNHMENKVVGSQEAENLVKELKSSNMELKEELSRKVIELDTNRKELIKINLSSKEIANKLEISIAENKKLQDKLKELTNNVNTLSVDSEELDKLQEELRHAKTENEILLDKNADLECRINSQTASIVKYKDALSAYKDLSPEEINNLEKVIADTKQKLENAISNTASLVKERDELQAELFKIKEDVSTNTVSHETEINNMQTEYENKLKSLTAEYEIKLNSIISDRDTEIEKLTTTHEAELNKLISEHKTTVVDLKVSAESEALDLNTKHDEDITKLKATYEGQLEQIKLNAKEEIAKAQKDFLKYKKKYDPKKLMFASSIAASFRNKLKGKPDIVLIFNRVLENIDLIDEIRITETVHALFKDEFVNAQP